MRTKLSIVRLMIIGFSAVCLLAWAAPAAASGAGDRPVPPGLNFIFDKDAYGIPGAQAGPAGTQSSSKFSIKLYGGYSNIAAGDVNDGSDGFFEAMENYAATGGAITGGYSPLHGGYNFGADLIYQITPSLGVGLGAGFMRSSSSSLATLTDGTDVYEATAKPTITAIPIRLGVYFTFPVAGNVNFTADIGGTYYAGLKLDATQRFSLNETEWLEMSVASLTAGSPNLGFHGSLGLEYKFSPKMGFFVEAVGRYAKLKNFDEVTGIMNSSFGGSSTTDGKLYIRAEIDPDFSYSMFTVEETTPVDDVDTTYREPKIDLSGFSLQAGLRIRF